MKIRIKVTGIHNEKEIFMSNIDKDILHKVYTAGFEASAQRVMFDDEKYGADEKINEILKRWAIAHKK